jgi:hypothetical protein
MRLRTIRFKATAALAITSLQLVNHAVDPALAEARRFLVRLPP